MSLATRCTSCGTVFRVVQDQLKVSEGWVRCGRCDEVFNALEGLFDLDRDSPPEWSEPVRGASGAQQPIDDGPVETDDPELVDRIDEQIFGTPRRTGFGALTGLGSGDRKGPDFADARFDTDVPADAIEPVMLDPSTQGPDSAAHDGAEAPEFVRNAEREARWQSSGARKGLWLLTVSLALLLVGQAANHFRDGMAARLPGTVAALEAWCRLSGCTIEPPRRIEDIVVESTALAKAPVGDAFRLSVTLRNRATTVAALPWIDLSLTDANGQMVARRALSPNDFRSRTTSMQPGGETSLQAMMSTGATRIAGYTVEVFYP
jgi:predicted Zn finger-like uncharacterized protein